MAHRHLDEKPSFLLFSGRMDGLLSTEGNQSDSANPSAMQQTEFYPQNHSRIILIVQILIPHGISYGFHIPKTS